jgi:hypothetical protein
MLNSQIWERHVLPVMAPKLGLLNWNMVQLMNTDRSLYPSEPLIDTLQWRQIMDYYTALAPDSIDAAKDDEAIPETFNFLK